MPNYFQEFNFAHPWWLLLLLCIPPLALLKGRLGTPNSIIFSSLAVLAPLGKKPKQLAGRFSAAFMLLALGFAIVALARPQKTHSFTERKASGIDIVVAMDISRSMDMRDFFYEGARVPRHLASRKTVQDFIKHRPSDRIGIISFAGRPYMESPITLEHDWLTKKVENIVPSRTLDDGTSIGSAISTAAIQLEEREDSKSRIIVLLTDGSDNSAQITPTEAAKLAKTIGIKIYTVAIGSTEGRLPQHAALRIQQEFDPKTLQDIASITGAKFYHAKSYEALRESFSDIDQLEKTEEALKTHQLHDEYFQWPAALALLFATVGLLLQSINLSPSPK